MTTTDMLEQRLHKIQRALHKATQEAYSTNNNGGSLKDVTSTAKSPRGVDGEPHQEEDATSHSSFHLGMDLFGSDPSTLERHLRDKLDDLDLELNRVLASANGLHDDNNDDEPNEDDEDTLLVVRETIQDYQHRIMYLKQASVVRGALDEAATMASAALSVEPHLGQASRHLLEAQQALCTLQEMKMARTTPVEQQHQQQEQQILRSLQQTLRRQRLELLHKANTVLDTSLLLDIPQQLSVKSSSHLEQAFEVLDTLMGGMAEGTSSPSLSLDETVRRFTRRLVDQVVMPLLEPLRSRTPITDLRPVQLHQRQEEPTQRMIGVSTNTARDKVVHRIQWHRLDHVDPSPGEASPAFLDWPVGVWKNTLSTLQQILVFVQTHMLLANKKATALMGKKLFGSPQAMPSHLQLQALGLESTILGDDAGLLQHELLRLLEQTCLPHHPPPSSDLTTVLAKCQTDLRDAVQPFCQAMQDCGLWEVNNDTTNKMIDFVEHLPEKYVQHRRCVLLNQARDILKNHDYHNTIMVGVDEQHDSVDKGDPGMSIFLLQRSSVSVVASELMALIRSTMTESTQAPFSPSLTTLRPALYKAAREMLTLFRAIIPALYGTEIASVPRTAAVFYNDCIFLAHHCLTLGVEFREQYPEDDGGDARGKLLKQSCIFVDNVPLFRELADQSLGDMLDVQANALMEIVGERIGYLGAALQSHESLLEWSEAETALAAGVYHLRHLAQSWRPILSRRIFSQCMGQLADVILNLFWKQVVVVGGGGRPSAGPVKSGSMMMTPNARHFLLGLFRQASQDLKDLFLPSSPHHPPQSPEGCRLEDCCSEWSRFEALVQFLDMSHLSQVELALASGVFRPVAALELSHLIHAAFVDSSERQALLNSLSKV